MSVNTWSLKQRIKELTNENNELRRKRAELEEKVAAKSRQEEEILASRPKPRSNPSRPRPIGSEIVSQDESDDGYDEREPDTASAILMCVALDNLRNVGLQFSNEQKEILGDLDKYEADASIGSLNFHVKFSWNALLSKANSIDIQFSYPFHKLELSPWMGNCIRKNNLKKALQSIVEYAKLFHEREETLKEICNEHEQNFTSEISTTKRAYVFCMMDSDFKYLEGTWSIKWDSFQSLMCHSFAFDVAKTPQGKSLSHAHKHILKELLSMERSLSDIKKCLLLLIDGMMKRPIAST